MKKAVSYFLLILFLYNVAGTFISFKAQQHSIRREIKSKIKKSVPENELILLSFHPSSKEYSQLDWIEGHEFRYQGQMFDMVRQTTGKDGLIHFYCINDTQEEILFAHLDEYVKNHVSNTSNRHNTKKVQKGVKDLFFHSSAFDFIRTNSIISFASPSFGIANRSADIFIPPPEILFS